jgi:hypothetical protein
VTAILALLEHVEMDLSTQTLVYIAVATVVAIGLVWFYLSPSHSSADVLGADATTTTTPAQATSSDEDVEYGQVSFDDTDSKGAATMTSMKSQPGRMANRGSSKSNPLFDQSIHVGSGVRESEFAAGTGDGTRKLVADASQVIANSIRAQRKIQSDSAFAMFNGKPKIGGDGGRGIWAKEKIAPIHESLLDGSNPFQNLPADFHKYVYKNTRDRRVVADRNPTVGGKWDRV